MKMLIIAEKPSVALDYKIVLQDDFVDKKKFYEGSKYIISYAVGHLLTIQEPREISLEYRSWSLKNLPILPPEYPIKPLLNTKAQLEVLIKLIKRKDVDIIVNGCDAGREGELIFRYILEYATKKALVGKTIKRLWLNSMTKESIIQGFENLKSDESMQFLYDAARSRAEADWVVGMNASRALTSYQSQGGGFNLTPCGRVQTPTLMMMTKRELERRDFKSQKYFKITGVFGSKNDSYEGQWFDPNFKAKNKDNKDEKANRLWDIKQAEKIIQKCQNKTATIQEKERKSQQSPPLLYDLTTLQREASNRFGFSAKTTLSIAQSLYETHKLISYPRTASKHLPQDYVESVKGILKSLSSGAFMNMEKHAKNALDNNYVKAGFKKIFDNSKVSDHFAIIPTLTSSSKKLVESQAKIYLMILQRFIGAFYPPAEFLNMTRISIVEDEHFKTEGKVLTKLGFLAVYNKQSKDDTLLNPLNKKDSYSLNESSLEELVTKPPARFTEATLLSGMEYAGRLIEEEDLKEAIIDSGIGTPATRASIIEKLITDKYVVREEGYFIPTEKALFLHQLIHAMKIDKLGSASLTGQWESKLLQVEQGKIKRNIFMKGIENEVSDIVKDIQKFDEAKTLKSAGFTALNKEFNESLSEYISTDNSIKIRKVMGGRSFKKEEVIELLENKKIGPLDGFRSRRGFPFSAVIILDEDNQAQFKFEDTLSTQDLDSNPIIGKSPIDGSDVFKLDTAYVSRSFADGKKTGLKISRMILGQELLVEDLEQMLNGNKTRLIEGFKSARTKRLFNAYLNLSSTGKIEFSFEEKKPKKPKTTGAKKPANPKVKAKSTATKKTTKPKSKATTTKKTSKS